MRLISLTFCVGKVMEHACFKRVTTLLEKQDAFGIHIIGFRKGLSTQDAMLQIQEQVVNAPSMHERALLGLDLKSAFDTVKHKAILDKISRLDLGARFHRYVSSFLNGREATVKIYGAPQRTVRMGDDVTVWTMENTSVGEMQDRLQRAVLEVERHLEDMGLVCSPDKLEILLHRPRKKGPLPQAVLDARRLGVRVKTREGTRIPTVSKLRTALINPPSF
ncbi:uncharacterized protein LOC142559403 [Dermacentor variabilis]|uniref:uncharacterized protein LOC142559403 n=1 Tax=Dermacentor variabilis TaxID=34621 RepID=UPI003F5AE07A